MPYVDVLASISEEAKHAPQGSMPTAAHGEYLRELQCEIAVLMRENAALREREQWLEERIVKLEHALQEEQSSCI
jgi:hypothetical protein